MLTPEQVNEIKAHVAATELTVVDEHNQLPVAPVPATNAFTIGLANWNSEYKVGVQEHAVSTEIIAAVASDLPEPEVSPVADAAINAAKKHQATPFIKEPQSAKDIALAAQARRVSRRLLLAERAKQVTVTCPETGIVSQLNIPAIPGHALIWTSPLSSLANCRGIAQQGVEYLKRLDTQVLAGIAITLAEPYELFRFAPYDSGAQKNAILRTSTKRFLIDAIIMIEERIHSQNARYLPPLNLHFDKLLAEQGVESRMKGWLNAVADAIRDPDISELDLSAKPQFPIRPVYERDTNAHYSLMAKSELEAAKKQFKADKVAGKELIKRLAKEETIPGKFQGFLNMLFSDEGLTLAAPEMLGLVSTKLESFASFSKEKSAARELVKIIRRDRRILAMGLDQVIEQIKSKEAQNEAKKTTSIVEAAILAGPASLSTPASDTSSILDNKQELVTGKAVAPTELVAPEGLDLIGKILWKKKMLAASAPPAAPRTLVTSELPSTVTYTKPVDSKPAEVFTFVRIHDNRIFHIYSSNNHKSHMYYIQNDFGILQMAIKIDLHGADSIEDNFYDGAE